MFLLQTACVPALAAGSLLCEVAARCALETRVMNGTGYACVCVCGLNVLVFVYVCCDVCVCVHVCRHLCLWVHLCL